MSSSTPSPSGAVPARPSRLRSSSTSPRPHYNLDGRANQGNHRYSEQFTNAHFVKVDVDDVPDVAQELGVRAMPTFILFQKGEKVAEVVGMNPPALLAAIEKLAGGAAASA